MIGPVPSKTKIHSNRVKKVHNAKKIATADCFTPLNVPNAKSHMLKTIEATNR